MQCQTILFGKKIVNDAQLNNIQTALAGAILIDPVNLTVVKNM